MSAQDYGLVFNERRGNPYNTGQVERVPKTLYMNKEADLLSKDNFLATDLNQYIYLLHNIIIMAMSAMKKRDTTAELLPTITPIGEALFCTENTN